MADLNSIYMYIFYIGKSSSNPVVRGWLQKLINYVRKIAKPK
jgi:hypothetical protein